MIFLQYLCDWNQYPVYLPNQGFSLNTKAISFDKNCSKDVVTLGRDKETHDLVINTYLTVKNF